MSQPKDDIKIRVLPRKAPRGAALNPPSAQVAPAVEREKEDVKPKRWIVYVGSCGFLLFVLHSLNHPSTGVSRQPAQRQIQSGTSASVTRHLQDAQIKQEMLQKARALENLQTAANINDVQAEGIADLENSRTLGVSLDQDNSAQRIFDDLNEDFRPVSEMLPADRINARLVNRKWMNQMERAERIQFIRNFIRTAYDSGYEVQIDQNLVVVGLRRINPNRKVNINQVIDQIAKQGQ
jgi:hypothetical protein